MRVKDEKAYKRARRHLRVRKKIFGTSEKPRLCVYKSLLHIYAQIIDDTRGHTLASACSLKLVDLKPEEKTSKKILQAREVGRLIAEKAKEQGIAKVVFDRGGYIYHGRVAAVAEGARKNGLEF
jgi:large subunit ribosomal protein L18